MKNKVLVLVITLSLLLTVGLSYAYFTGMIYGDGKKITVSAAELRIVFTDNQELSNTDISPGWSESKSFSVKNESDDLFSYNIVFENLINTFVTEGFLQYKITSDTGYNMDGYLDIPKSSSPQDVTLAYDIVIEPGVTHEYEIEFIYHDSDTVDQSEDMGKTFSGNLAITVGTIDPNTTYVVSINTEKEHRENLNMENCKISLGISADLEEKILKPVMMEFIRKHPNVSIKIINGKDSELTKKLIQYSVDFIIHKESSNTNIKIQEIETKELYTLNYSLVYNKKYFEDIESMSDLPFIVPLSNSYDRIKLDNYFEELNIKPKIKLEVESLESLLSYVNDGLGVAIIINDVINSRFDMLSKKQLSLTETIKLSYIKEKLTPFTEEFIKLFNVK